MHELAHLLLGHDPTTMYVVGEEGLALREFDQSKEQEADWLAGALLLPRGSTSGDSESKGRLWNCLLHLRGQPTDVGISDACDWRQKTSRAAQTKKLVRIGQSRVFLQPDHTLR